MGAFFLFDKTAEINVVSAREVFQKKGFILPPVEFESSGYNLWLFRKILINENNYYHHGGYSIFSCGTPIYKSLNYQSGLQCLLNDFITNTIEFERLIGNYTLIFKKLDKYQLLCDEAHIAPVYYDKQNRVISSSFLGVAAALRPGLTINKNAALEILLTGSLIGPETQVVEILRIEKETIFNFPGVQILEQKTTTPNERFIGSKKQCINFQINKLLDYFESIKEISNSTGTMIGLTGGFDSRLLMALSEKKLSKNTYYSHWRKEKNLDFDVAGQLAESINKPLHTYPVTYPLDLSEENIYNRLDEAFYFYDGQIRSQIFWYEEYNTLNYSKRIYENNLLGISGIGGELYRNYERMNVRSWNFMKWVLFDIFFMNSGIDFSNDKNFRDFLINFTNKLRLKLNLVERERITRYEVKRYHAEAYSLANRVHRTNAENQLTFCLAPFAEYSMYNSALEAEPFLGHSMEFQSLMIEQLSSQLSKITSSYGYSFHDGEPFYNKIAAIIKDFIPKKYFFMLYNYNKQRESTFVDEFTKKFNFSRSYIIDIQSLFPNLDVAMLKQRKYQGSLMLELAHFRKLLNV